MTPLIGSVRVGMSSAPSNPAEGELYYDTDDNVLYAYSGTSWLAVSAAFATGGTETTYSGYKVHTFTSNGTFAVSGGVLVCDILIVAGGGSGGGDNGGGGGAGGMLEIESHTVSSQEHSIVIGAGAAARAGAADDGPGSKGSNSTGFGYTAIGGGAGTGWVNSGGAGTLSGGSGGGQSTSNNARNPQSPGSGTSGQGNAGGEGYSGGNWSGGGGGAGSVGSDGGNGVAGTGGTGKANNWRTGSNVTYCGGGTGGWNAAQSYTSSGHGSNNGVTKNTTDDPSGEGACAANTGHGGHGSNHDNNTSGAGGSGIVVIRYAA